MNNLAKIIHLTLALTALAAMPASNSFQLHNYGFGNGGTAGSSSATYSVNGLAGEQANGTDSGATIKVQTGNNGTQQANVPTITLTNSANYYNKLLLVIGPQANPTDATFAVAISTDNFATTNYVKSDGTVGASLVTSDYRNFASWGSGSGAFVIGLTANTSYTVKAKAFHKSYTETGYGPTVSAATVNPQLSFSLSTTSQPTGPFTINLGRLIAASVVTATDSINIGISTNGEQGGAVYISDTNAGLKSTSNPSATIASATADLAVAAKGFGVQVTTASQTSGGPLASLSPYNGATANVGIIGATIRQLLSTSVPVTTGTATLAIKGKATAQDVAANDYTDTLTLLASGSF